MKCVLFDVNVASKQFIPAVKRQASGHKKYNKTNKQLTYALLTCVFFSFSNWQNLSSLCLASVVVLKNPSQYGMRLEDSKIQYITGAGLDNYSIQHRVCYYMNTLFSVKVTNLERFVISHGRFLFNFFHCALFKGLMWAVLSWKKVMAHTSVHQWGFTILTSWQVVF